MAVGEGSGAVHHEKQRFGSLCAEPRARGSVAVWDDGDEGLPEAGHGLAVPRRSLKEGRKSWSERLKTAAEEIDSPDRERPGSATSIEGFTGTPRPEVPRIPLEDMRSPYSLATDEDEDETFDKFDESSLHPDLMSASHSMLIRSDTQEQAS